MINFSNMRISMWMEKNAVAVRVYRVYVCALARGYRKLYDVDGDDESKFIKVILLIEYITLGCEK